MVTSLIRALAVVLLLAVVSSWVFLGAHPGWTKTSVATMKTDEITGIEFPEFEDRFVPGVEFLGLGVAASLALGAISFLPALNRKKP